VLAHNLDDYAQPRSIVGDVAKAALCANPGHRFIVADFSGIESRVLAWISGQQSKRDQWAKFDQTQNPEDEPYAILGKLCGFPPGQARNKGKTFDLAFGYMGGVGAYRKFAPGDPSTDFEIKGYQTAWRKAHPATVSFWGSLNRAAIKAVRRPGETIRCNDRNSFRCDDDFLRMKLPSGRELAYPIPRLHTNARGDCIVVFKDNKNNQWIDCRHGRDQEEGAHGGTWAENVVQAAARDLLAAAMQRIEAAGYPIVLHVHDEIVARWPWQPRGISKHHYGTASMGRGPADRRKGAQRAAILQG
jgi:DNA polymerase bacteriophage-type